MPIDSPPSNAVPRAGVVGHVAWSFLYSSGFLYSSERTNPRYWSFGYTDTFLTHRHARYNQGTRRGSEGIQEPTERPVSVLRGQTLSTGRLKQRPRTEARCVGPRTFRPDSERMNNKPEMPPTVYTLLIPPTVCAASPCGWPVFTEAAVPWSAADRKKSNSMQRPPVSHPVCGQLRSRLSSLLSETLTDGATSSSS